MSEKLIPLKGYEKYIIVDSRSWLDYINLPHLGRRHRITHTFAQRLLAALEVANATIETLNLELVKAQGTIETLRLELVKAQGSTVSYGNEQEKPNNE